MKRSPDKNLEKQHQLFLSGQYNTLFNDMNLNLPYRFFAYAEPESLDLFFVDTFRNLNKTKVINRKQDTWSFDQVIKLLSPNSKFYDRLAVVNFLVKDCNIPEGHFILGKPENVIGEIFPQKSIILSRYAMMRIVDTLLRQSKQFDQDLQSNIFTEPKPDSFEESKNNFLDEARWLFARQYFADPVADCEQLIEYTWTWIRGEQLRPQYSASMKNLRTLIMNHLKYSIDEEKINAEIKRYKERFYQTQINEIQLRQKVTEGLQAQFDDNNAERFKQRYIFDLLFAQSDKGSFKQQYESALQAFGYQLTRKENQNLDEQKKWRRGNLIAPGYPGSYFTPDLTFFITWALNNFSTFIDHQSISTKNKNKGFEILTEKYFSTLKDAWITENRTRFKNKFNFIESNKFVDQHDYYQAHEIMKQLFYGTGRSIKNSITDEKYKENPGAYQGWREKDLLTDDDRFCLQCRQIAENTLQKLHNDYLKNPSTELTQKISDAEDKILYENMALYGQNFQGYVKVPITLNENGEFVTRPVFGPAKIIREYRLPTEKQNSFNPVTKQFTIFDTMLNPYYQATSRRGVPVAREIYAKNKEDWHLDKNGIFQTLNPMIEKPKSLRKYHGQVIPSLHIENFHMYNFLFESDILSYEKQLEIAKWLVSIGVASRVVYSGKKSIHILISIKEEPKNKDEYTWLFYHLGIKLGLVERTWNEKALKYDYSGIIDLSCNKPNRSTRRPGAMRPVEYFDDNGKAVIEYVEQTLLHDSDTIYDYNWRGEYMADMLQTQQLKKSAYNIQQDRSVYFNNSQDINKFVTAYAAKNNISLAFEQGVGHLTGCTIIGAAKKAGFDGQTINNWLKQNCARYDELYRSWQGIIR